MNLFTKFFRCATRLLLSALLLCTLHSFTFAQEARLLRFPNIHGDKVVFCYGGDLYLVHANGGVARQLTSHIGYEMFPHFSPDGTMIAFTGQYDGNTEIYVIPAEGGIPKRLTYTATMSRDDIGDRMGPNNIVTGWTPDGKSVVFRNKANGLSGFVGQLMTVPIDGGLPSDIPLMHGGFNTFSPDGKMLAYNYIQREFRSWKRYQGGMADDIRIFDFNTKQSVRITDNVYQDVFPMWTKDGSKIYYLSDRDKHMNLYVYHVNTKTTEQLTFHKEYDIKFPSIGENTVVYEHGGYLYKWDAVQKKEVKIPVEIKNDLPYSRPQWIDLSASVRSFALSTNGERLLVSARGDIFSIPAKEGITYNLTNTSSSHNRLPAWAPDGKGYAYVSDKDGEFNIYYYETASGKERKLTDIKGYIFGFRWSPDSKKILWSEKMNTLNLLDVATGKNEVIEQSGMGPINNFNWSPDSKLITYTLPINPMSVVMVYDTRDKKKTQITDQWYSSGSSNFSKEGKHLLFTSNRAFNPTNGSTEFNHIYTNMTKIYILPITNDAFIPLAPKNDMVAPSGAAEKKDDSKELAYNFSNIARKIVELPVPGGSYSNLHMIGTNVYYNTRTGTSMYDMEAKKTTDLLASITFGYDYKKAIAVSGARAQVIDVPRAAVTISTPINLSGVKKLVNYREEWKQIFHETWRQMRDFFYAKNMHGVDWDAAYQRHAPLVAHVAHRSDLTYLIGELIGELNVGHAYSQNGERPEPKRVPTGLLGATFSKDKSGFFKVEKVLEGANWDAATRSPLTMPGVDVNPGDFILAINGRSLKEVDNLFEYLIGLAGVLTEIDVNTKPELAGSRKVLVEPLADENTLYYYNWVQNNIKKVSEATNGAVGYIHIPDMGTPGLNEWAKHYYPQLQKKALIIDDRYNGGGNVSPMIIERLQRTITYFTMHTNQTEGSVNPVGSHEGPKVLLMNEYSASDGDLFPYRFKHYELGTVIGRRTWGGTVGYSGSIPVVDNGSIVTPSYAPYAHDGSGWIIEGEGVEPHIDIENDPYK
ncbi:MAG: PDZ domain-containing protein, partial [Bacteroidales bacterium]|nr:PDZ domain-containing protein [Bacteroidales bacterium]